MDTSPTRRWAPAWRNAMVRDEPPSKRCISGQRFCSATITWKPVGDVVAAAEASPIDFEAMATEQYRCPETQHLLGVHLSLLRFAKQALNAWLSMYPQTFFDQLYRKNGGIVLLHNISDHWQVCIYRHGYTEVQNTETEQQSRKSIFPNPTCCYVLNLAVAWSPFGHECLRASISCISWPTSNL